MKLLLLSLVLLGITLIDGTPAEKREVGKEVDKNADKWQCKCSWIAVEEKLKCEKCDKDGCNEVSIYDCPYSPLPRTKAVDEVMRYFKKEVRYNCKCTYAGYCEQRPDKNGQWHTVKDCGGGEYTACDEFGCRGVYDGKCHCERGYCVKCSTNGCQLTERCEGYITVGPYCQYCDLNGCEEVPCLPQCADESEDVLVGEKCARDVQRYFSAWGLCGNGYCKDVANCDRFATCKCDMRDDTYKRCYGFRKGHHSCITLDKCSNVVADIVKAAGRKQGTCVCPPNFGLCKQCDFLGRCTYVKKCGGGDYIELAAIERKEPKVYTDY